jgi:hypothetical protein
VRLGSAGEPSCWQQENTVVGWVERSETHHPVAGVVMGFGYITRTTEVWEEHAEAAKFAEMTLDEFKAKVKPSLDCREKIASLRRQLEAAIKKRQKCDAASTMSAPRWSMPCAVTSNTARTVPCAPLFHATPRFLSETVAARNCFQDYVRRVLW